MSLSQSLGQSARFAAENEDVTSHKFGFPRGSCSMFGKEPECPTRQFLLDRGPIIDRFPIEMLPVIHARPLQVSIVQMEPQRTSQP